MTMQTQNVDTTILAIGDIVHFCGGRFEMVSMPHGPAEAAATVAWQEKNDRPWSTTRESEMNFRVLCGKFIGDVSDANPCSIPEDHFSHQVTDEPGSKYLSFLGNHLDIWVREVEA